ncbi:MAG: hypothetical protein LBK82_02195 [Planctomycetaceae bacterium]|jgi:hypothetical protein|nr:hypothetical protein [Planctomycetaceae bacterium]
MNNQFDNIERYGDDLSNASRMGEDIFETEPRGLSRGWFLPIILLGGLLTTSIVFVAIYVINIYTGHNVLAFLVNFIIPLGAIFCGFLAGIGYALSARFVQFYPDIRFIFFIFVLQFSLFFVARYMEYTVFCYNATQKMQQHFEHIVNLKKQQHFEHVATITDEDGNVITLDQNEITQAIKKSLPSFIEFYRTNIEESEWVGKDNKPFTMGKWGWAIEFLMAFVFALCSLAASGLLALLAYCKTCRRFMSQKLKFTFPMRAPKRKIKKNDEADLETFKQEEIEAISYATEKIARIEDFLKSEQSANRSEVFRLLCAIRDEINAESKPTKGVPNVIQVTYSECNSCDNFLIVVSVEVADLNNKTAFSSTNLFRFTNGNFVANPVSLPTV